ncbi:LpqB family beta-propeller domain-containing protein [Microbacterium sp. 2MCAF23]|uniref:LpqB family beta-propeller domain-containing protein n=1 Tax=Microbacterium sp. 2MCAF23 TaxID=3232985 RepID=UPI003F9D6783
MTFGRILRGAVVALALLGLTACASLPITGDVRPGLSADQSDGGSDLAFVPQGPSDGMDPKEIVRGFIDAASSPKDSWGIARQFLTSGEAQKWKPDAGVTIDTGSAGRRFDLPDLPKDASSATVRLGLQQTGIVDETGAYSGTPVNRAAELPFELAKNKDGQWRISAAPDGIVLDADSFAAADVFAPYDLQYFDPTWTYLVPDVRWFPKRENTASRIVQSLVSGKPSSWLNGAVRTAFTGDIALGRNTVTPDSQVAEVALTNAALDADPVTLARMRTQLERSLSGVGVLQVKLTVSGRDLNAGSASPASTSVDSRPLVLTDKGFGYLTGGELAPVAGVSAPLQNFPEAITAIRAASGAQRVAVQGASGHVYAVTDGRTDEIDARPGLIVPTLDPYGYIWTVPQSSPSSILAWSNLAKSQPAFAGPPDASQIMAMAVSRDGARLAMAVSANGQIRIEVAAITRDDRGAPTAIGVANPNVIAWPTGATDITWLDDTTVGVLTTDGSSLVLRAQQVGGPAKTVDVPDTTQSIAPASPSTTVQLLGNGVLWVRSGPTPTQVSTNVKVLAVQMGGS